MRDSFLAAETQHISTGWLARLAPLRDLWVAGLMGLLPLAGAAGDRALIVAATDYDLDDALPADALGRLDLPGLSNDVATMKEVLSRAYGLPDSAILVLDGKKATRAGILSAFDDWLVKGTNPGDRAVFYFTGHGLLAQDQNGDETDGYDEALAPIDINRTGPAETSTPIAVRDPAGSGKLIKSTAFNIIRDDELAGRLAQIADRRVLFLIDACQSGTASRAAGVDPGPSGSRVWPRSVLSALGWDVPPAATRERAVERIAGAEQYLPFDAEPDLAEGEGPLAGLDAWSASASFQLAFGGSDGGVFTRAFRDALLSGTGDRDGDGRVTNGEVLARITEVSGAFCQESDLCQRSNGGQLTPQFDGDPAHLVRDAVTGVVIVPDEPQDQVPSLIPGPGTFGPGMVALSIEAEGRLQVGTPVRFQVKSAMRGRLTLIDFGPGGSVLQVVPNRNSRSSELLRPGEPFEIPTPDDGFDMIPDKAGRGRLLAVVSEQALDLSAILPPAQGPTQIDGLRILGEIRARLEGSWASEVEGVPHSRPVAWGAALVDYEILP